MTSDKEAFGGNFPWRMRDAKVDKSWVRFGPGMPLLGWKDLTELFFRSLRWKTWWAAESDCTLSPAPSYIDLRLQTNLLPTFWGCFKRKTAFCPFWGHEEDLRGTKKANIAPNFAALLLGNFYYKTGAKMRFLAKMLAADQSNAIFAYNLIRWATYRLQKSRSRGKDDKLRQEKAKMRKKTKHWNMKNPPSEVWFCTRKLGEIGIWPFFGPLIEVMAIYRVLPLDWNLNFIRNWL